MIEINAVSLRVHVSGKEIDLSKMEFKMLRFLAKHPDQVFSMDALIDRVWGIDVFIQEDTVRGTIKNCRRKIRPYDEAIENVRGEGYRLNPKKCEVRVIE